MDGDSGDAGNDELTCVRSDESDKSSWSVAVFFFMNFTRQTFVLINIIETLELFA